MMAVIYVILFVLCYGGLYILCSVVLYWRLILGIYLCMIALSALFFDNDEKFLPGRLLPFLLFISLGFICFGTEPVISPQISGVMKLVLTGGIALSGVVILLKGRLLFKPIGLILFLMGGLWTLVTLS